MFVKEQSHITLVPKRGKMCVVLLMTHQHFSLTAFWISADLKFSPKYPQIMTTCPVLPQQLQIADPIHITFKT